MRTELVNKLIKLADDPKLIFLTGDLGFNALEPLQDKLGNRFINCGIAEQNMVGIAAGLAMQGYRPWVYSIAPFLYARALEQIRNDVCFNNLPVTFVGNGGGYSYGIMGSTHHALEDLAIINSLPNIQAYIPAFKNEIPSLIDIINHSNSPSYIRLENSGNDNFVPQDTHFYQWRKLAQGSKGTLICCGPLINKFINKVKDVNIWQLGSLPIGSFPYQLGQDIFDAPKLVVVEEHIEFLAKEIFYEMGHYNNKPPVFISYHCKHSPKTGTQEYLRSDCGLNINAIISEF